jgi:hypothetical protein
MQNKRPRAIIVVIIIFLVIVVGGLGYVFGRKSIFSSDDNQSARDSVYVDSGEVGGTSHFSIILPGAIASQRYSASLKRNALNATLTPTSALPPGLSIYQIALPCVPPLSGESDTCPNEYDLAGIPTRTGTYMFDVEFHSRNSSVIGSYAITVR